MSEMKNKVNTYDARDELLQELYQDLLTYAQVSLWEKSLVEDVVQDAFAVLMQKPYDEMDRAAMFTFLCSSVDFIIKRNRYKAAERSTVALEDVIDHVVDEVSESEAKLFDTIVYQEYGAFLEKKLSKRDFALLLICEKHESVSEKVKALTKHCEISEAAARMRFTRLRQRVRKLLKKEFGLDL